MTAAARAAAAPLGMACRVVAIDGPGGAGKSTLASRLAERLGAPVVPTDDFASWEDPLDWWPRLLEQVLHPLAEGSPVRYQRYDWDARRLGDWREIAPAEYLILDGVSSSRRAFQPFLALSVWVLTPREERLRRGLERDGPAAAEQWRSWMAAEDAYIQREQPHRSADLVVSGYDLDISS